MTMTDFDLLIFDADGTLRECILPEPPCPDRPWEWALLPDVKGHECWRNPAKIAIASNQGGVGLGIIEEKIARQMLRDLFVELVGIQPQEWQIQMCPHLPDAGCLCRKPEPQMLIAAMKAAGVDGGRVLYIGDS